MHKCSKKSFQAVDAEDAVIADAAAFAGGKGLDVVPTTFSIEVQ